MNMKSELNKILLTLNEVEIKGYNNVSLMLGVMQKIQELMNYLTAEAVAPNSGD